MLGNLSGMLDQLTESLSALQGTIHALVQQMRVQQELTQRVVSAMEAQTQALEAL